MYIPDICGYSLHAPTEWENCLFKLLNSAVGEAKMVVNVRLVSEEGFVLKCIFKSFNALFVLLIGVVSKT
jgi:hypothetical protein